LIVDVVVRVLQDELFAAERGLGVVLLQDVKLAEFHPEIKLNGGSIILPNWRSHHLLSSATIVPSSK
jgi:hypothetical protein